MEIKKIALIIVSILLLSGLAYSQEDLKAGVYDREYYRSGQLKYELIVNDPKDGGSEGLAVAKNYYESGRLEYEVIAKDINVEQYIYKEYYTNGQLKLLCNVKNDEYHGIYISYNENGQLVEIAIYKDGDLIDYHDYHEDEESIFWG